MNKAFGIVFYRDWATGRQFKEIGRLLPEVELYQAMLDLVIYTEETRTELTANVLRSIESFGGNQIKRSRGELLKIDSSLLRQYGLDLFLDLFNKPWFNYLDSLKA